MKYDELLQIYKPFDVEFQVGNSVGVGVTLTPLDMLRLQNVIGNTTNNNWSATTSTPQPNPSYINVSIATSSIEYTKSLSKDLAVIEQELNLDIGGKNNTFSNRQILIDSDRVIINAKDDYGMFFAKKGLAFASEDEIHFDSDTAMYVYANQGIYLGIPDKKQNEQDIEYEPLVLGDKLLDILQDLIIILKSLKVKTNVGSAYIDPDIQEKLVEINDRLPEILSTNAFIDGYSHRNKE